MGLTVRTADGRPLAADTTVRVDAVGGTATAGDDFAAPTIPMIYGIDAVHVHGNVYGATIFPHNIGLGSTRDPALVSRIGHAVAQEVRATGIPWNFPPCVCVTRDERWGRSYDSFGETPALVVPMTSIIDGLQGTGPGDPNGVSATAKHYAGDGDTGSTRRWPTRTSANRGGSRGTPSTRASR